VVSAILFLLTVDILVFCFVVQKVFSIGKSLLQIFLYFVLLFILIVIFPVVMCCLCLLNQNICKNLKSEVL
jgi:hypothetical protein